MNVPTSDQWSRDVSGIVIQFISVWVKVDRLTCHLTICLLGGIPYKVVIGNWPDIWTSWYLASLPTARLEI